MSLADSDRQLLNVIVARVPPKLRDVFHKFIKAEAVEAAKAYIKELVRRHNR